MNNTSQEQLFQSCLKETVGHFYDLFHQLDQEDYENTDRVQHSFFLNSSDVLNLREKMNLIKTLLDETIKDIIQKKGSEKKEPPYEATLEQKKNQMNEIIDLISSRDCKEILSTLKNKIEGILKANPDSSQIKDLSYKITPGKENEAKRAALMVHSFNHHYFFTFLAKMVKTIKETLGIKTTAQKLFEKTVENIKKATNSTENTSEDGAPTIKRK